MMSCIVIIIIDWKIVNQVANLGFLVKKFVERTVYILLYLTSYNLCILSKKVETIITITIYNLIKLQLTAKAT